MEFLAVVIAFLISISVSGHIEPAARIAKKWRIITFNLRFSVKVSIFLYALLPALMVGSLLYWLHSGLLNFVIAVGVLILSFEAGDVPDKLASFKRKLGAQDQPGAWQIAVDGLGLESTIYGPDDESIEQGVQSGMAYLYLERFFVTVFWFVAFGVAGVLLVWLTRQIFKDEEVDPFCHRVKHALYWIPVRLMAFTLGLMGNFSACFSALFNQAKDFDRDDRVLLVTSLQAALGPTDEGEMLDSSLALLKRAQWSWLVGLALVLIFG